MGIVCSLKFYYSDNRANRENVLLSTRTGATPHHNSGDARLRRTRYRFEVVDNLERL